MLKSFTPAITLLLIFGLRIEEPSVAEMLCVGLITLGAAATTRGEIALPLIGLALQLGANVAEAARIVLSQQLLSERRMPLLEMQCVLLTTSHFEPRTRDEPPYTCATHCSRCWI